MSIKILSPHLVNQIAAGEVLERPAAAVKELVENAIDAGATRIEVDLVEGGRELIVVTDNGKGMSPEDLSLCVERHATSKLTDDDLTSIQTMGFRGEALPSIGAVARLTLTSKTPDTDHAWQLTVTAGEKSKPMPASLSQGTRVEIKDLFFATPARLKFMKTAQVERRHCQDIVERLALANPHVGFKVTEKAKAYLDVPAGQGLFDRINAVCGKNLAGNVVEVEAEREGYHLSGYIGLPTFDVATAKHQHFFVNNRWVRDKLFGHALKFAYQDVLAKDKTPFAVLYLKMPLREVDVNVHPSKIEIRFIDPQLVRGLLVSGIREALSDGQREAAPALGEALLSTWTPPMRPAEPANFSFPVFTPAPVRTQTSFALAERPSVIAFQPQPAGIIQEAPAVMPGFLGQAVAQIHGTYIVSQTLDGLILVDQHAAHERINYEEMKAALANKNVQRQRLLMPEIIDFSAEDLELLLASTAELQKLGLTIEPFGTTGVMVTEVPVMLGDAGIRNVVQSLVKALHEETGEHVISNQICEILAESACKNSIKKNDRLSLSEMNALLRQMEKAPKSAQCNHGRPTYITLQLADIERLFGRR